MVVLFKGIILLMRYILTLSALPAMILLRFKIGANSFGPFSNKSYGTNSEFQYKARWWVRLITVAYLYLWIRMFWIIQVFQIRKIKDPTAPTYPDFFEFVFGNPLLQTLWVFDTGYESTILLHHLSYSIPILGLLHIMLLEVWHIRKDRLDPLFLGRSWLLGWAVERKYISDLMIWSYLEPIGIGLLGLGISKFDNNQYYPVTMLIWFAAISMAIQGQARRMRYREKQDELNYHNRFGKKIIEKEERQQSKRLSTKNDSSNGDEAIFL